MNEQSVIKAKEVSFKEYLFKNRQNQYILTLAAVAIALQFVVFKYFYPFASYIHGDSFSYLNAAQENSSINIYPIGYSKFLRIFSVFSRSDMVLTAFQYLIVEISALFLLFTLCYFYSFHRVTKSILLCFIIFNPLFLHLANLVSSDCLFLSLSMTWFTLLLWIIERPSTSITFLHAIMLVSAFTVRYNALIYPFIALLAFYLSKMTLRNKMFGVAIYVLFCGIFVFYTSERFKILTGKFQFSPFTGWQFANNAMYAYRYVESAERKTVPSRFKELDQMICKYFDSTRNVRMHPIEDKLASTYYMWSGGLPLMRYKDSTFKKDTASSELKKWSSMGPYYKDYGLYIIKTYPWEFLRYFIWPNSGKYFAPPIEFLEEYNSGKEFVTLATKDWFEYKSDRIRTRTGNNKVWILDYYPILSGIANTVILGALICFLLIRGPQYKPLNKGITMAYTIWMLNAGFTIFASSAALRFQSFPIIIAVTLSVIMIEYLLLVATTQADYFNYSTRVKNETVM